MRLVLIITLFIFSGSLFGAVDAQLTSESTSEEKSGYTIEKISPEAHVNYLEDWFKHPGLGSPDKQTSISFESYDPVSYTLTVHRKDKSTGEAGEFYQTVEQAYWSPDSKHVAFVDDDYYAGMGEDSLTIINVETLTEIKIPLKDLVYDHDIGEREMFYASTPCWIANDKLVFAVKVNYLGESGHPGIDSNREGRLGDNFGLDDPVDLGSFVVNLSTDKE